MSEYEKLLPACLCSLKQWLDENPHMPPISDEVLQVFLNCRHYDIELTKKTIERYLEMSTTIPELFSNYDPLDPEILKAMAILHISVLPEKDSKGRVVLIYKLSDEDPSNMCFANLMKFSFMSSYIAAIQNRNAPGYVLLFDSNSVKFGHITKLSISLIRKCMAFVQEASPIDIQRIHVINTSYVTYTILDFIRPFMKKELSEKVIKMKSANKHINVARIKVSAPIFDTTKARDSTVTNM